MKTGKRLSFKRHSHRSRGHVNPTFFPIQRKCEQCEEEDKKKVQKKGDRNAGGTGAGFFQGYMQGIHAKGQPLPESTRTFFENRLGGSFGDVRLHTDDEARMAAKDVRAKAFTWRNHVVLNREYFRGQDADGRRLLAHELTHVMQQRGRGDAIQRAPEDNAQTAASGSPTQAAPGQAEETQAVPGEESARSQETQAVEQEEAVMEPMSLPDFTTVGKPSMWMDLGKSITVTGKTDATFDGGTGTTKNLKAVPAKDCSGCTGNECITVTGQLVITYNVSTSITLPDVPEGLTPCQQKRVRDAIDTKISPHEDQHVAAFNTYNGTVTLSINYTGCKAGLAQFVQDMHDADGATRKAAAKAKSAALDPFNVPIDLDCEEPPKK